MEYDEMLRMVDGCGWLWMVMDGYGWLWMVMAYMAILGTLLYFVACDAAFGIWPG